MGARFNAYLASLPSLLRNTWRRKQAPLEKSARIAFRTSESFDVERFIADYDDVCRRSWRRAEPFPSFMPALLRIADGERAPRYGVLDADG